MIGFMGLQVEEIIYQGNYYGEYFSAGDESATETNSKDIKMFYGKEDHDFTRRINLMSRK